MSTKERILYIFINSFMRLVLRSPLHWLASGSTLLLDVQGRKSARRYTIPVSYVQQSNSVTCCTSAKWSSWWRNLRSGDTLTLRLKGRVEQGNVQVLIDDSADKRARLKAFLMQFPGTAARYGVQHDSQGQLDPVALDAAARAASTVVIVLVLTERL